MILYGCPLHVTDDYDGPCYAGNKADNCIKVMAVWGVGAGVSPDTAAFTSVSAGSVPLSSHALFTPHMRPSTEGGFLTYPCVFPGCITKAISLDSVLAYICITDWPTDPSLPERTDPQCISPAAHAKSIRSVDWRR